MINVINRGVKNGYGDFSVKNRKTYTSRFFFHDWIFFPDWKEKTYKEVVFSKWITSIRSFVPEKNALKGFVEFLPTEKILERSQVFDGVFAYRKKYWNAHQRKCTSRDVFLPTRLEASRSFFVLVHKKLALKIFYRWRGNIDSAEEASLMNYEQISWNLIKIV